MAPRRIAAFDFDGTLSKRDTLVPFFARAVGPVRLAAAMAATAPMVAGSRFHGGSGGHGAAHPRDVAKAAFVRRLFAGRRASWLQEEGRRYADALAGRLRPEMVEQVEWHRASGHELVIVSAGLRCYLEPFAQAHGFDHVIAVELEVGPDDRLTGNLLGANVRGPEKAARLRAWLGDDELEAMWAYGNSSGDRELLAMAHTPVWVAGPDARRPPSWAAVGAGSQPRT